MMFIAHDIKASRVNLLMNDYAAGLPSPLSFLGLGESIVRDLGLENWDSRTIPILHSVSISDGRTKPEMERKSGKFMPVETMEDLTGSVHLSLIIDLPGCDRAAQLKELLQTKRIAGGAVQNEDIRVESVTADGSVFRKIRRGYAMLRPDTERLNHLQISCGTERGLENIAYTVFPAQREPGSGWFVPVSVGYKLLENADLVPTRIRTRNSEIPHVFAEPILGIAELVSVRNYRLRGATESVLQSLFWNWTMQDDYILGHINYMPKTIT